MSTNINWNGGNIESASKVLDELFAYNTDQFNQIPRASVREFMTELPQQIFNQMGKGQVDEIKKFRDGVRASIQKNPLIDLAIDDLPKQVLLAIKANALAELMDVYLDQPNTAKSMISLLGKKMENRRALLELFLAKGQKITTHELQTLLQGQSSTTRHEHLTELCRMGLLKRQALDQKAYIYEITLHGRQVGKLLRERIQALQEKHTVKQGGVISTGEIIQTKKVEAQKSNSRRNSMFP